jgi:SAM-dependent methyltransferase
MAFEELKARHAAMWGSAPFEQIAGTLAEMHDALIGALAPAPGERWLDVGCGTGELAFRGAATGADIVGADLAPVLVDTARRQAAERGLSIPFEVADCERLPFADASFDVVSSSVGAIFAPDHGRVADELARVSRPGGRLGLTAWTADGEVGAFFATIARYAPPPPPGVGSPLQWGDPAYCAERLGDGFELAFEHRNAPWEEESPEAMWDEMATSFGPIKTLLGVLEEERAQEFREEMIGLFGRMRDGERVVMDRPYLLVVGTRR